VETCRTDGVVVIHVNSDGQECEHIKEIGKKQEVIIEQKSTISDVLLDIKEI
jgi:hypothetical protein